MTAEIETQQIVRNPRVHGGEPVIQGTRVPVRSIVIAAEEYGGDLTRIGEAFSVDAAAVRAALAYYEQHKPEIDQLVEAHERAAGRDEGEAWLGRSTAWRGQIRPA